MYFFKNSWRIGRATTRIPLAVCSCCLAQINLINGLQSALVPFSCCFRSGLFITLPGTITAASNDHWQGFKVEERVRWARKRQLRNLLNEPEDCLIHFEGSNCQNSQTTINSITQFSLFDVNNEKFCPLKWTSVLKNTSGVLVLTIFPVALWLCLFCFIFFMYV